MASWYYRLEGQEVGPADEELIAILIDLGHIAADTEVRQSDQAQWQRAQRSSLAHFFKNKAEQQPPSPSQVQARAPKENGTQATRQQPSVPKPSVLLFFRSCVLALIVLSIAYALVLTYVSVEILSPQPLGTEAAAPVQTEVERATGLLSFLVEGISIALAYTGSLIILGLEVATLCLALFVMLLYLHWIFTAARHLQQARQTGPMTKPHHALLWHLLPGPNLVFPPRLMLRLYRWAERERGNPEAKRPRALALWWGASLLALLGAVLAALVFFVPGVREIVVSGAVEESSTETTSVPSLVVVLLVIVFWLVPVSLSAFLWLQSRISPALYLAERRR